MRIKITNDTTLREIMMSGESSPFVGALACILWAAMHIESGHKIYDTPDKYWTDQLGEMADKWRASLKSVHPVPDLSAKLPCPACDGTGEVEVGEPNGDCRKCGGDGKIGRDSESGPADGCDCEEQLVECDHCNGEKTQTVEHAMLCRDRCDGDTTIPAIEKAAGACYDDCERFHEAKIKYQMRRVELSGERHATEGLEEDWAEYQANWKPSDKESK